MAKNISPNHTARLRARELHKWLRDKGIIASVTTSGTRLVVSVSSNPKNLSVPKNFKSSIVEVKKLPTFRR